MDSPQQRNQDQKYHPKLLARRDVDWIIASSSDVHVVNHRDWFASYTPFETYYSSLYSSSQSKVVGIGTVHLNVRLHKQNRSGKPNSRIIILHNVLYAPDNICNIFGQPRSCEYKVEFRNGPNGSTLKDKDGKRAGLIDCDKLFRLRLYGQSAGQSSLDPKETYMINAQWPVTERVRWLGHLAEQLDIPMTVSSKEDAPPSTTKDMLDSKTEAAPYSTVEKAWLKIKYDGEYKFLQTHGLSIYKDEDRAEGRSVVRAMMKMEDLEDENDLNNKDEMEDEHDSDDNHSNDDGDRFLRECEEDPMSHVADYNFSEAELDWIQEHYQYSSKFMLSFGLKPFEQESCDEAKSILKAMMESD